MNKPDLLKLLLSIEWAATDRGQGSNMGSNDGPDVRCCPKCGGIDPSDGYKFEFNENAHGHHRGCKLRAAIRELLK